MKKVVITGFGDEGKLAIIESELPDPQAGEVQLTVEYSIVSGSDVNMRRCTYPFQKKLPLTPGYSVLGKIRVNGAGCSKVKVGERVVGLTKYEGAVFQPDFGNTNASKANDKAVDSNCRQLIEGLK